MRITMMAAVLAAMTALASGPATAQEYPVDLPPDASTSGALTVGTIFQNGSTYNYFNYPGDADAFRFNLVAGKSYSMVNTSDCMTATLTLLNSSFKRLAILDPDPLHMFKAMEFTAKYTGLYFLKVIDRGIVRDVCKPMADENDYGEAGWYRIVAMESCAPNSSTKCGLSADKFFTVAAYNDKNWHVFNVTKPGIYEIDMAAPAVNALAESGATISLRRADSTLIAQSGTNGTCHQTPKPDTICMRRTMAVGKFYVAVWMPLYPSEERAYHLTATKVAN